MKYFTALILVLSAAPALANSIEDAVCRPPSTPVIRRDVSEKLCRSFALAIPKLPEALADEARVLLSPENVALMVTLTAAWVGSQGIPVVGQAVDATLLLLGVTLLAAQTATLVDALWQYVNHASLARTRGELDSAAGYLARAISVAGVNVVAFILTKKAVGKIRPPTPRAPLDPLPAEGPAFSGAAAETNRFHAAAPALSIGSSSEVSRRDTNESGNRPKSMDLQAFARWVQRAPRRQVPSKREAHRYQREHAGPEELLVKGGGAQIWADGPRMDKARLIEAKHVDSPDKSPFIPGSKCNDKVRLRIQEEVTGEFRRYAAVIKDPATPVVALEVITNDARAAPYFESLLKMFDIPGEVIIKP